VLMTFNQFGETPQRKSCVWLTGCYFDRLSSGQAVRMDTHNLSKGQLGLRQSSSSCIT